MKTKKPAPRQFKVDDGVGFDAAQNADGYGFKNHPAVAVSIHPLRGMQIHGPFVTAAAARAWIDRDGDAELLGNYGDCRAATWHVECLDVPRSY